MRSFVIEPRGPFSLLESGARPGSEDVVRLAFVVDGYVEQVGVELRQPAHRGPVTGVVFGEAPLAVVVRQVTRMLCFDHLDPQAPLLPSVYEAAAWCVLSARRPQAQSAAVRDALSYAHGASFILAQAQCSAFPTPGRLLGVTTFPGVSAEKIARLHGVAEAAASGLLDNDALASMGSEMALSALQAVAGIGPLDAAFMVSRALGFPAGAAAVVDEPG